jgi:hypothetical protein
VARKSAHGNAPAGGAGHCRFEEILHRAISEALFPSIGSQFQRRCRERA